MSSVPDIKRIAPVASDLVYAEPTQTVPELFEALRQRQSVWHYVDSMFKCIPFKDNATFWQRLGQ